MILLYIPAFIYRLEEISMNNSIFDNLFIFEMANSHQGSVEHGKDIIRAMGRIARKNNIIKKIIDIFSQGAKRLDLSSGT